MKNSGRLSLLPAERVVRIRDLLAEQGMVTLAEVAAATNASPATVRRDLAYLEKRGLLVRTRGGATVVSQRESRDEEFSRRQSRDRREKRLVAGVAAERLREGDTVFLNDGTSVYALAQRMVRSFKGTVITSGLNIAELLAHSTHVHVIVVGGHLRGTSFGTIGSLAAQAISQLHADVAVIACDGVTATEGVRSNQIEDAAVARTMSEHADRTIVLASSSKIENIARVRIVEWSSVDELIAVGITRDLRQSLRLDSVKATEP